jgi:hypothetical protein
MVAPAGRVKVAGLAQRRDIQEKIATERRVHGLPRMAPGA